jgi:hypothetical protein
MLLSTTILITSSQLAIYPANFSGSSPILKVVPKRQAIKKYMSIMSQHRPDCGGALFEDGYQEIPHFRRRIGHAYSLNALLAGGDDALETALWAPVRSLQENAELKERTAAMLERSGENSNAVRLREDAKAQMEQSKLLRDRIVAVQKRA